MGRRNHEKETKLSAFLGRHKMLPIPSNPQNFEIELICGSPMMASKFIIGTIRPLLQYKKLISQN